LVSVLAALTHIRHERDFGRRKDLLLKWVNDNCDALDPHAAFIKLDIA
jgi:hypothetical protein